MQSKFKSSTSKGFTLIELLVVVAIISLLSSVILAALRDAREKAQDSKVVSQLLEMRKVSELSNTNGSYGTATSAGDCGSLNTSFTNSGFNSAANWPAIDGSSSSPTCISDAANDGDLISNYSIWYPLNNQKGWCIDNVGNSVSMDTAPTGPNCTANSGGGDSGGGGLSENGVACSNDTECTSNNCGPSSVCIDNHSLGIGASCNNDNGCESTYCDPYSNDTCQYFINQYQ